MPSNAKSLLNAASEADSPLPVIALFILLSESLAGAGAIATDGTTRIMLTIFAVSFPFVVLGVFVWLLVAHTEKLYAPSQYTPDTSIAAFAQATRRETRDAQLVARGALRAAVAPAIVSDGADVQQVGEQIVARYDEALEEASVKLVRRLILDDDAETISLPVSEATTVQELLDSIYLSIASAVGPYTYGIEWVLVREDHEALKDIGSNWAEARGSSGDERKLSEVGIGPGSTLTAIRRGHRRFPTGRRRSSPS